METEAVADKKDVAFIIPSLNEEHNIGEAIESIKVNMAVLDLSYELVVVDNGSRDNTVQIAQKLGAAVVSKAISTISGLRNTGVENTTGNVIVFIDADVYLSQGWSKVFQGVFETLLKDSTLLTGSTYKLKASPAWVEKSWYEPVLMKPHSNYINGGHLILSRTLFRKLGGFNEKLETGEDYEFCQRARKAGVKIINNKDLHAVHKGYPVTVRGFFQRERWHGKGDFQSWKGFIGSKPALLACVNMLLILASLSVAILARNAFCLLPYFLFAVALCGASAYFRCRKISLGYFQCAVLYYVYFIARGISLIDVLADRARKSSKR